MGFGTAPRHLVDSFSKYICMFYSPEKKRHCCVVCTGGEEEEVVEEEVEMRGGGGSCSAADTLSRSLNAHVQHLVLENVAGRNDFYIYVYKITIRG